MSRSTRQFLAFLFVVAVSIAAGVLSVSAKKDVERIEPKVTRIVQATAACRAEVLDNPRQVAACARRIEVGLSACRHDEDCRAAFTALMESAVREGVVPGGNNPSGLSPGPGFSPGPENPVQGPPGSQPEEDDQDSADPSVVEDTLDSVQDVVEDVLEPVCTAARHLLRFC